jgi:multidrug efflux pump subunit AcrB
MGWDRSGGLEDLTPKGIILRSVSLADSSWLQIPVGSVEGRIVRINDLCRVIHKEKEPRSYYRINGNNSINVVFTAEKGSNSLNVASDIKKELEVLSEDFPPGYLLLLSSDSTELIKKDLNKIYYRTFFSFTILLLFVFLISRQFRYLLIIFISLLANLCSAFILYYVFGVEINLYSLAGITVSLGLIIDNTIVMVDHIRTKGNRKVFLAIMAATLTTIGALSVIRFFGETTRLQLKDFSMVLIINLFVSLMVALFLVPALLEKIPLKGRKGQKTSRRRRKVVKFSFAYGRMIGFSQRYRWAFILMAILLFGLPTFKIPTRMEGDEWYHKLFQKTLASDTYVQKIKPVVDKALGGTLRLFSQNFRNRYSYRLPQRTQISVTATLPQGSTLQQMNDLMIEVEYYLKGYDQIDQFVTSVSNARNGRIMVNFKPDYELGAFPFILLSQIQDLSNNLTGADWRVYGLGQAFSNSLTEHIGSSKIVLYGYNYEDLMGHAITVRDRVLAHDRVEKSSIISQDTYWRDPVYEFGISLDPQKLQARKLNAMQVYNNLEGYSINKGGGSPVFIDGEYEQISLRSSQSDDFDIWMMGNTPVAVGNAMVRLDDLGERKKQELNKNICKENQQYRLIVEYDFIGNYKLGRITRDRIIREMSDQLPIGYTIKQSEYRYWQRESNKQFLLILMVIAIIYMICAILLESLKQPLAVVLIIPVSYVGVFLTFYLFDFSFDQGGFAAFLLLSGIVVNAALYILNDFNNYNKRLKGKILPVRIFLKAFNGKIIPIFLTVLSTVFGLIPFIAGGEDDAFWFSLAAGTMGGLLFSVAAIFVFLPAFLSLKPIKQNK